MQRTRFHVLRRNGFTLIEAAIVTVIIGLSVVALLQLLCAGSMANGESTDLTTAIFLAENINERMQGHPYDTLKSTFDNVTYGGNTTYPYPKDGRGQNLTDFSGWSQTIDVSYVDPEAITITVPDSQVEVTSMVTVRVVHNTTNLVYVTKWLVAAPE
jgi:Tfp pilus assembly protein PilV